MNPRRGLSLTEVLIAIFVMAIGMISLLVLFPPGR
jgi:prepilin-type N-terminal cleavage/methylation domain-containing protein